MFGFEEFREISGLDDQTSDVSHLNDIVGDTKIAGFDGMTEAGNDLVTDYLKDNIPIDHLKGCPEIRYAPNSDFFIYMPTARGVFDSVTNKIEIAGIAPFESMEDMLETITHEIGHNKFEQLEQFNPQAAYRWESMYTESIAQRNTGFGFVSEYAKTNPSEDFAESYRYYINDPELLKIMCPGKYEFMKNLVFNGREYSSLQTTEGTRLVLNKGVADTLSSAMNESYTDGDDFISIGEGESSVADTYRCFNMVG